MENAHENTSIGNLILENRIGNCTIDLIDNANGRFNLNGIHLLVEQQQKKNILSLFNLFVSF
jgi:hypothetical protein